MSVVRLTVNRTPGCRLETIMSCNSCVRQITPHEPQKSSERVIDLDDTHVVRDYARLFEVHREDDYDMNSPTAVSQSTRQFPFERSDETNLRGIHLPHPRLYLSSVLRVLNLGNGTSPSAFSIRYLIRGNKITHNGKTMHHVSSLPGPTISSH